MLQIDWDPEHAHALGIEPNELSTDPSLTILGPTTHPKNQLRYVKFHGSIETVQGSDLPPFEADIIDGGAWIQESHLPSGEVWINVEHSALLRYQPYSY